VPQIYKFERSFRADGSFKLSTTAMLLLIWPCFGAKAHHMQWRDYRYLLSTTDRRIHSRWRLFQNDIFIAGLWYICSGTIAASLLSSLINPAIPLLNFITFLSFVPSWISHVISVCDGRLLAVMEISTQVTGNTGLIYSYSQTPSTKMSSK
jgi:hypothetical protein